MIFVFAHLERAFLANFVPKIEKMVKNRIFVSEISIVPVRKYVGPRTRKYVSATGPSLKISKSESPRFAGKKMAGNKNDDAF